MLSDRRSVLLVAGGALLLLAVLFLFSGVQRYRRPLPAPVFAATRALPAQVPGDALALPWPDGAAATIAVEGGTLAATHGDDRPRPLASVTKIMTALVVLTDHPLQPGEAGPTLTITETDTIDFRRAVTGGESAVLVEKGEQLTEYQLLQGLLIPSANNFADLLARWDAGSVEAFVAKMNARARTLEMTHTHYADASGNDPSSVGTASDQVLLARAAMQNAVFAEIVAQPQADLPAAGTVYNVDAMLGEHGVVGVKTGSSPEAGAGFVFAADAAVGATAGARPLRVYGAVLGLSRLQDVFTASGALIDAVATLVRPVELVAAGATVGEVTTRWGERIAVTAGGSLSVVSWPGEAVQATFDATAPLPGAPAGTQLGTLTVDVAGQRGEVPLLTAAPVTTPGWRWRVFR